MQHGSSELHLQVRGQLIASGTSLNKWCQENGVSRQWAELALKGDRKGPAAQKLIERLLSAVDEAIE
jgi:hypothetical protein